MKALLSRLTGTLIARGCYYTGTDAFAPGGCPQYLCQPGEHIQIGPCYWSMGFNACRCNCCSGA